MPIELITGLQVGAGASRGDWGEGPSQEPAQLVIGAHGRAATQAFNHMDVPAARHRVQRGAPCACDQRTGIAAASSLLRGVPSCRRSSCSRDWRDAVKSPKALEDLEQAVEAVKTKCPKVKWKDSYAVMGPYDYIDIFEAPDFATAAQVSA